MATYADQVNSKYLNTQSNFINLIQRLNDTINNLPPQARRNWQTSLAKAISQFKKNNPKVKDFSDRKTFRLCQAVEIALDRIHIDTTMQREPDLKWIIKIISEFRAYQAMPVQVYRILDANGNDTFDFGSWDGQHTALALYLIAVSLQLDTNITTVPCNIYATSTRGELRNTFIRGNTTTGKNAGKKSLDHIDIMQQMIYGVRCDNVTDPEWVEAEQKQTHIERAGLFLTAEKFGDHKQTGAISRLNELVDSSVEVVRQFSVYGKYVVDSQATATLERPINSKEIPIIMAFFDMCEADNVVYSDDQIRDIAQHCIDLFDANFDADSIYWSTVHQANINAWNRANKGIPTQFWSTQPKNNKTTPVGTSFFWHQLRSSWLPTQPSGTQFPKLNISNFVPSSKDLF